MAIYSGFEQFGLTLNDLDEWNRNSPQAFNKFFNAIGADLNTQAHVQSRLLCSVAKELKTDFEFLLLTAGYRAVEVMDNWINQGNEYGGQVWEYQLPPIDPPGRLGDKLLRRLSLSDSGNATRMQREYRGDDFLEISLDELFHTWRRLLKTDFNFCLRRHYSDKNKTLSYSDELGDGGANEDADGYDSLFDTPQNPLHELPPPLADQDEWPSQHEKISASLSVLAQQAIATLNQTQLKARGKNGIPFRFILTTRLFMLYVLEACTTRPQEPALTFALPPSLPCFIAARIGLTLDDAGCDQALEAINASWLCHQNPPISLPSTQKDGRHWVFLIEHLSQQVAPTAADAPAFQSSLRNNLLSAITSGLADANTPNSRGLPGKETALLHLQKQAGALEEQRWATLKNAFSEDAWPRLEQAISTVDWNALIARVDARIWRGLLEDGLNPAPDIFLNALYGYKSLYQMWHQSCRRLLTSEDDRRALDTAKSRLESQDALTSFYAFIGAWREPKQELCRKITSRFAQFIEGDIDSDQALWMRQHFHVCPDCRRRFNAYVSERMAWGYRPQPRVARLREMLHAATSSSIKRLKIQLGTLLTEGFTLPDLPRSGTTDALLAGPISDSETLLAPPTDDAQVIVPFKGFSLRINDPVAIRLIDPNGPLSSLSGTVTQLSCDPDTRSASVTVTVDGETERHLVLAARFSLGQASYSLSGEMVKGVAVISLFDAPVQLHEINVEVWYAVDLE